MKRSGKITKKSHCLNYYGLNFHVVLFYLDIFLVTKKLCILTKFSKFQVRIVQLRCRIYHFYKFNTLNMQAHTTFKKRAVPSSSQLDFGLKSLKLFRRGAQFIDIDPVFNWA